MSARSLFPIRIDRRLFGESAQSTREYFRLFSLLKMEKLSRRHGICLYDRVIDGAVESAGNTVGYRMGSVIISSS